MKKILVVTLWFLSFSVFGATFSSMCELTKNKQIEYNKKLPIIIDDVTTFIGFESNCDTKTVRYNNQIFFNKAEIKKLKPTLKEKFLLFAKKQCSGGYPKNGWNVSNYYYDKNMVLAFRFIVNAKDCERIYSKKPKK